MTTDVYPSGYSLSTNYTYTGLNNLNQGGSPIVMPSSGYTKSVWIHGGGYGTTAYMFTILWDEPGAILGKSGTLTMAAGRSWFEGLMSVKIDKGVKYWAGFWANPSYSRQWSDNASGPTSSFYWKTSTSAVTTLTGGSYTNRVMCTCITYTSGHVKVWNGSSWVPGTVKRWDGSSWVEVQGLYTYSGGWNKSIPV